MSINFSIKGEFKRLKKSSVVTHRYFCLKFMIVDVGMSYYKDGMGTTIDFVPILLLFYNNMIYL